MAHYRSVGDIPPKRHTQHRDPAGSLYREELMGEEGFSTDSSLLYHRGFPSAIVDAARSGTSPSRRPTPTTRSSPGTSSCTTSSPTRDASHGGRRRAGRRLVLGNGDVRISYAVTDTDPSPLYRNGIGDECVYVECGGGRRRDGLRQLDVGRATTSSSRGRPRTAGSPRTQSTLRVYCIEANSHIAPPKRYLSRYGQLLEHAPYCERDLHGPTEPFLADGDDTDV